MPVCVCAGLCAGLPLCLEAEPTVPAGGAQGLGGNSPTWSQQDSAYTRFGSTECPDHAVQLYEGFIAGKKFDQPGGGADYLCMHPDPEYPVGHSDGNQDGNLLYGTEYENSGVVALDGDAANGDAACSVCQTSGSSVYIQWGRQTCSNGHTLEYAGLVMSTKFNQRRVSNICVDRDKALHTTSDGGDQDGALLYTTEMELGSADEVLYPPNREVGCAACSVPSGGTVYTRWGSTTCTEPSTQLYEGFVAGSKFDHSGGGADYLCMHPDPEYPVGHDDGNHDGNLLYGTEYQESILDGNLNLNGDAACGDFLPPPFPYHVDK